MTLFPGCALVTGAASGIGRQVAISFAEEGCLKLAICDQNDAGLTETCALIKAKNSHAQVVMFCLDLSDKQSVIDMTAFFVRKLGRIDYAVNSAGIGSTNTKSTETSIEAFDRVNAVNLRGLWLCSRSQLKQMLQQEPLPTHDGRPGNRGSICNIGSQLGLVSRPAATAYCAAKAAAISMTKSDAIDYSKDNIRINCVSPGLVKTPMNSSEDRIKIFAPAVAIAPMNRMGTTQEIADACLFMCSSKATFCQGSNLIVDGGYTIN